MRKGDKMTDLMFSTGFVPQEKKVCIRCLGVNDNPLQQLCDTCRKGDILADYFSTQDESLMCAAKTIRSEWEKGILSIQDTKGWYELELAEEERMLAEDYRFNPPTGHEGWSDKMIANAEWHEAEAQKYFDGTYKMASSG